MKKNNQIYKPHYYEFVEIKTFLKTTGIKCCKYNYSMDDQKTQKYEAIIKLSLDEQELIIINKLKLTS